MDIAVLARDCDCGSGGFIWPRAKSFGIIGLLFTWEGDCVSMCVTHSFLLGLFLVTCLGAQGSVFLFLTYVPLWKLKSFQNA
uniref:Uncharacterized protein n=1 Tax=Mus musculus TaxID=10090 RepID=Q3UUT3_MOUSE|nr:unnamed protein product [Mus musculus]